MKGRRLLLSLVLAAVVALVLAGGGIGCQARRCRPWGATLLDGADGSRRSTRSR
jgi:hypothetical protein